ncbi:MAG TPA: DNA-formamidopyrimidine glycosylase family protein [Gemmatimonadales bacterium]|nr:DNA-formamidopyrimidine glycosylase family protein [Gemmatimonadales bacterium]
MPELPDIAVYLDCLRPRVLGRRLDRITFRNPFVLRSVTPAPAELTGALVTELRRLGKRIVLALEGERFIVIHLMIAGRLRWHEADGRTPGKAALALFEFGSGTLVLTEAGSTRRASVHLVGSEAGLGAFDRGGLEVLDQDGGAFADRLLSENHTLKRALTDPRLFSGIGNAYSDEILHRARLSPLTLTRKLASEDIQRLYEAARLTLAEWTVRLRAEVGEGFPDKVTAFREGMAVHGRYGQPCPECGAAVQRIRYAANETNYCARCQTGGRLLADRAMSRILREDWPRSLDELE